MYSAKWIPRVSGRRYCKKFLLEYSWNGMRPVPWKIIKERILPNTCEKSYTCEIFQRNSTGPMGLKLYDFKISMTQRTMLFSAKTTSMWASLKKKSWSSRPLISEFETTAKRSRDFDNNAPFHFALLPTHHTCGIQWPFLTFPYQISLCITQHNKQHIKLTLQCL